MNLLAAWKSEFRRLEDPCPWPGPRPLSREKDGAAPWRFVGREAEIDEFLRAVDDHSLVLLHGESGAGKSSLLNVGLLSVLRRSGFVPLVCNEWHGLQGDDPEEMLAGHFEDELDREVRDLMDQEGLSLVEALDEVHDGHAVLVLDQFEELIRTDRERFATVVDWVLEINAEHRTKVVLSLRSEYLYRLDRLLTAVRPFSFTQVRLEPMTKPSDIAAVILSANHDGEVAITEPAAERLVRAWLDLPAQSPERSLLYLHATLYALFWRGHGTGRGVVEEEDVASLEAAAGVTRTAGASAARLFAAGFDRTIDTKLELCAQACGALADGPDLADGVEGAARAGVWRRALAPQPLVAAAREQIRESVEHLSSGGYKVQQELPDLFLITAERELELLARTPGSNVRSLTEPEAERLVAAVIGQPGEQGGEAGEDPGADQGFDLLVASRLELLELAGIAAPPAPAPTPTDALMAGFGVSPQPWVADRDDVTAGVLLGRAPWEALVEHVRAFSFAMEWLREAAIVRISSPAGTATATLVHDGFGVALKNWAMRNAIDPMHVITALSAFRGERWSWGSHEVFDGAEGWRTVVNVRWRRCEITDTVFRRVVFVNCDFRATRFLGCTLEGVTFVNCLLDGASFEDCAVIGRGADHSDEEPPYFPNGLPEFLVDVEEEVLADFRLYRGSEWEGGGVLYSPTSGVAAVPWSHGTPPRNAFRPSIVAGGLTMFGGRLSSLMLRACDKGGGSITLAHIAGSSLDVVEQDEVDLTLSWCAILGLTVSDKVDASEVDGKVQVTATQCVLANTWFGPNLNGSVTVDNCLVYAMTNLSPALQASVVNSAHGATLAVSTEGPPAFGEATPVASARTLDDFGRHSLRMAYRSRPAEVELVRRAEAMAVAQVAAD